MATFPHYTQLDSMDCGPTCLRMISKYYGRTYSLQSIRQISGINREGVSLLGLSQAAEKIGFRTMGVPLTFDQLCEDVPLPCIAHWQQNHFVVVYRIRGAVNKKKQTVFVADPGQGLVEYSREEFLQGWIGTTEQGQEKGVALLLEPTPEFSEDSNEKGEKTGFNRLFSYVFAYKKLLFQLVLGLLIGSVLQLIFPFLTQSIVDIGINTQNLNFIYLVLAAQLMLFGGRTAMDFIRSWILLHISARVNVSLLSDFFIKLMKLPMAFFDTKLYGDLIQRINDHRRIENFLTNTTLQTLFSLFNVVIFGLVLAYYHWLIFSVFLLGSGVYLVWVLFFLRRREKLDHRRFEAEAKNQSSIMQLIGGMQEIKLSGSETQKRWEWERIQARLFKLDVKGLALSQYQQSGAFFINEGKNILITFLAAKAVVDGQMTLGAMLAVQYIVGQLNSPIEQLVNFLQIMQDARISLERLGEIHQLADEEVAQSSPLLERVEPSSLAMKNVRFHYPGLAEWPVLSDISLLLPAGKVTAIVGTSGSGKTTLLKLLLKFYEPTAGGIRLGDTHLKHISHRQWRGRCGVVMQDGFIFSDTIARNIAVGEDQPDIPKLLHAVRVAHIGEFIETLPLGYNTKIGAEGNGLSQGQKQRILIARAVYKDPAFLFFDEATNALDATSERIIMRNLEQFFKGRTVVVVAHRLSTVQHADQIIVLHKGKITEVGTHAELTGLKRDYYQLVKNQLELGN